MSDSQTRESRRPGRLTLKSRYERAQTPSGLRAAPCLRWDSTRHHARRAGVHSTGSTCGGLRLPRPACPAHARGRRWLKLCNRIACLREETSVAGFAPICRTDPRERIRGDAVEMRRPRKPGGGVAGHVSRKSSGDWGESAASNRNSP
jgi:hypothetical protein